MSTGIQDRLDQLERVACSPQLQNSESLSALFRFLVKRSLEDPENPPRELEIAMKVFGRGVEFDSRMDSTVRVQASRLRAKLAEYYAGPGALDPIVIEIPRGAYLARFTGRTEACDPALPSPKPALRLSPAVWFAAGLVCGIFLGWTASAWSHSLGPHVTRIHSGVASH